MTRARFAGNFPPLRVVLAKRSGTTTSEACTSVAVECHGTLRRRQAGIAAPPSTDTLARSTRLPACTAKARASRRAMPKPPSGITRAALQGFAHAQSDLGVLYEYGRGVPQDYGE